MIQQQSEFKLKLRRLLAEFEGKSASIREDLLQTAEVQPNPLCDGIDHAKEEADLHSRLGVHTCQMGLLDQIRTALGKIELGTFGICDGCDADIGYRRLQVQPWAAFCLKCQESSEALIQAKVSIPSNVLSLFTAREKRVSKQGLDSPFEKTPA